MLLGKYIGIYRSFQLTHIISQKVGGSEIKEASVFFSASEWLALSRNHGFVYFIYLPPFGQDKETQTLAV